MNCQLARFRFLVDRDGEAAALAWMAGLVRTYRQVVLERRVLAMKRRELVCGYVCAKRILAQ